MSIGIYLRLSLSDGDLSDKKESNSIENQRMLIREFIESQDDLFGEITEYVDDGYTGTNFERPGFKKLIEDAKRGRIKVIIAKDLSRLGRNYIELGDYLEQIFPLIGVRVIAIGSNYDSKDHVGDVAGFDAAITNFINTMYSKDLSVKHKSLYKSFWARGYCPTLACPYGYIADPDRKGGWLIDEEAAKVIRDIFEWAAQGLRIRNIVEHLNAARIEVPGVYLSRVYNRTCKWKASEDERIWDYYKVRSIIKSIEYTGDHYAHKYESNLFNTNKSINVPRSEWILIKDHHPGIVSHDVFELAQKIINKKEWVDKREPAVFALRSRIRCGNCRLMMTYDDERSRLTCGHRKTSGKRSMCPSCSYPYADIERSVFAALKKYLLDLKMLEYIITTNVGGHKDKCEKSVKYYESKIDILKAERIRQYEGYAQGLIPAQEYLKKKNALTSEINELQAVLDKDKRELSEDYEALSLIHDGCEAAEIIKDDTELTRKMVETFVKNVYVHDIKRIEVVYVTEDIITKVIRRNNAVFDEEFAEG